MATNPSSNFPLLASDQADVIRIYLDLMQDYNRAEQASEVSTSRPRRARKTFNNAPFAEPPELE